MSKQFKKKINSVLSSCFTQLVMYKLTDNCVLTIKKEKNQPFSCCMNGSIDPPQENNGYSWLFGPYCSTFSKSIELSYEKEKLYKWPWRDFSEPYLHGHFSVPAVQMKCFSGLYFLCTLLKKKKNLTTLWIITVQRRFHLLIFLLSLMFSQAWVSCCSPSQGQHFSDALMAEYLNCESLSVQSHPWRVKSLYNCTSECCVTAVVNQH